MKTEKLEELLNTERYDVLAEKRRETFSGDIIGCCN